MFSGFGMKCCSKCNESKSPNDFHKRGDSLDGRFSYCKACAAAIARFGRKWIRDTRDNLDLSIGVACRKCALIQPLTNFHKSTSHANGRLSICKNCRVSESKQEYCRNRERRSEYKREAYQKNPEQFKQRNQMWRLANLQRHRELCKVGARRWRLGNVSRVKLQNAIRAKRVRLSTPKWLTPQDLRMIEQIYLGCPVGCHVDHIYPLWGKDSCGLHCPDNLQIISRKENLSKSNKSPTAWLEQLNKAS